MIEKKFRKPEMEKETLYIQILLWAYERSDSGFDEKDLIKEFDLQGRMYDWYIKLFKAANLGSSPLVEPISYEHHIDKHFSNLTEKGMLAVLSYLSIKESQNNTAALVANGKSADRYADKMMILSYILFIVALLQLFLTVFMLPVSLLAQCLIAISVCILFALIFRDLKKNPMK